MANFLSTLTENQIAQPLQNKYFTTIRDQATPKVAIIIEIVQTLPALEGTVQQFTIELIERDCVCRGNQLG